jgi:hypothetical protein
MPYTMDDFRKEVALEVLDQLTPEERLRGLPAEERLRGLPAEELAKRLAPAERLRGLPAKQIEAYLRQQRKKPQHRRGKKGRPKR